MAVRDSCVVLLSCLGLPPGSPGRWVSPLSALLRHVFSVPNTTGVSLVHHAVTNFGPIPCPGLQV